MSRRYGEIHDLIEPLLGKPSWSVHLSVGSNLFMHFGRPRRPYGDDMVFGEWYLWVAMAAWRIEGEGRVIVGSEDPRPVLAPAIEVLEGRELRSVTVLPPALETVFDFDGITLCVFPTDSQRDAENSYEHWLLWTPEGEILTVGPGSTWSIRKSTGHPPPGR